MLINLYLQGRGVSFFQVISHVFQGLILAVGLALELLYMYLRKRRQEARFISIDRPNSRLTNMYPIHVTAILFSLPRQKKTLLFSR